MPQGIVQKCIAWRRQRVPFGLIAIAFSISKPVNAAPVNFKPWSVLKISGLPCFASASSNVSTQNAASMVIDTRATTEPAN